MDAQAAARITQQLADLRLQVNAIETSTKQASLPETMRDARRTIRWSAAVVAIALVVSSTFRACKEDRQVRDLEHRIETLERATKKGL